MEELNKLVLARTPILYMVSADFQDCMKNIEELANQLGAEVRLYRDGLGELSVGDSDRTNYELSLEKFLDVQNGFCFEGNKPKFLVVHNSHTEITNSQIIAQLVTIAEKQLYESDYELTVFLISPIIQIPEEIKAYTNIIRPDLPKQSEIELALKSDDFSNYHIEQEDIGKLALEFRGLNWQQIKEILNVSYVKNGYISYEKDRKNIIKEKKQIIEKVGLLEYVDDTENFDSIGGLDNLRAWLKKKSKIFHNLDDALKKGVDTPKGVLILGTPGCGKSLTAKATANIFKVPLVRLDVGRLLGKYIGESESNMKKALELAETVSPCVLWIDEIEKAFAGGVNRGHEVTVRLIGQFLTWLQEKKSTVFVVATSNSITDLPPEFLRKGRFDELFRVNLPNKQERFSIFKIQLKKRKQDCIQIDFGKILPKTEGFSGAEICAVVGDAVENMFIGGRDKLTTNDLLEVISNSCPLSKINEDSYKAMLDRLDKLQIKNASLQQEGGGI